MNKLITCGQKHPFVSALFLGAGLSLTAQPLGFFFLFWLILPAFLFLLHNAQRPKHGFFTAFLFALGYFTCSLYWIAIALFIDIARFWPLVPLALLAIPAAIALFWGIAGAIVVFLTRGHPRRLLLSALIFPLLLTAAELARGVLIFTGFPWNIFAYSWVRFLPILQSVSFLGVYGLSFLTCLAACLFAQCYAPNQTRRQRLQWAALSCAPFIALAVWGGLRLHHNPTQYTHTPIRLVQPNIAQNEKWDSDQRFDHFNLLLELSRTHFTHPKGMIIWPETALPYDSATPGVAAAIARHIPSQAYLLTGSIRRDSAQNHITNAIEIFDKNGLNKNYYDKFHLVPFGEYVPLRRILPLPAIANAIGDFNRGPGPQTITLSDTIPPFSPLICYEIIFPGNVIDTNNRPQWLVNVTNDAWYGNSAGPYQHFAIAQTRAVEEGLPMARAANTGLSGVVDPMGRIIGLSTLGTRGVVDTMLPQATANAPLASGHVLPWPALMLIGLTFYISVWSHRGHRK